MKFAVLLSFLSSVTASAIQMSGQTAAYRQLKSVMDRQLRLCSPVTLGANFCERSCGSGYETCVSIPNCYNPTAGHKCCSDGGYCTSGEYCINGGCCPDGVPAEQCGGTTTLSFWVPPTSTGFTSSSTSAVTLTSTSTSTTELTSTSTLLPSTYSTTATLSSKTDSDTSSTTSITAPATTSSKNTSYPTTSVPSSVTVAPTSGTNSTAVSPSPTFVTAGTTKNIVGRLLSTVSGLLAIMYFL